MNPETKDLIDEIIEREGGDKETNDPNDRGGRTRFGISERANPDLWADSNVTYDEAYKRFEQRYLTGPGFDKIEDAKLRAVLVDFGVTSGPTLAIQKLQGILKVDADGILGPKTLAALATWEPRRLVNKVALERVRMAGRVVKRDPSQLKWINGWLDRFSSFID